MVKSQCQSMFSCRKYMNVLWASMKYKHKHKPAILNCLHFCMLWCHAGDLPDFKIVFFFFLNSHCKKQLLTLLYKHTVNLSLQASNQVHPATVCMCVLCVCVRQWALWSSLGPEIKAMSASVWWDLTDDTSSLSLSFPFWFSSSHCPLIFPIHYSATSFCLLSTNFSHYLQYMSDWYSLLMVSATFLLTSHPPLCIYTFVSRLLVKILIHMETPDKYETREVGKY